MSVPQDVLERYPPRPYAEARAFVRDGDIVFCQGRDAFSRLIRWSTKSHWSHIGLVFRIESLDRVIVVEAVEKIGVRAVGFSEFVSAGLRRDQPLSRPNPGRTAR